jgi:hypothetical protein
MSTLAHCKLPSAYHLSADLRAPPAVAALTRTPPDEMEKEELLLNKLGARGWGRVHHFRNYYMSGWGDNGRVLSPKALESFYRFLRNADFHGSTPSVFLTDRGGLELCWEDRNGHSIQVEFTATGAEFYRAANEQEGFVPLEAISKLTGLISA